MGVSYREEIKKRTARLSPAARLAYLTPGRTREPAEERAAIRKEYFAKSSRRHRQGATAQRRLIEDG